MNRACSRCGPLVAGTLLLGACYTGLPDDDLYGSGTSATFGSSATDGETGDGDGDGDGSASGSSGSSGSGSSGDGDGDGDGDSGTTTGDGDGDGDSGTSSTSGGDGDGDGDSGTSSTSTSGGDGDGDGDGDVPDSGYCAEVADWDAAWKQKEEEILVIVNQVRAQGANCGSEGNFGAAGPLSMHPALRCAARKHSKDMNDRNFFDHVNPDGDLPWDRMEMAGYQYSTAGENIAGGNAGAQATMNQWMNSDGHCANIMNPDFEDIGVGYYPGGQWGHLWTQVFGAQ
jgi:uncharacterized protein YkwD